MTASEIAFLAFGLLLGATGGAAAAAVSRARARPVREIRVTVAPIHHPGRPATLATYLADGDPPPARGGPADPVELGLAPAGDDGRTGDDTTDDGSPSPVAPVGRGRAGSGGALSDQRDPRGPLDGTIRTGVRAGPDPDWVAVPIATGRDPLLGAILATGGDRRLAGPEPLADERHPAGRERALAAVPPGRPEPASDRRRHRDPAGQLSRPPRPGGDPECEPPTAPAAAARAHAGPGPADRGAERADRGAALEAARRGAEPPNSLAIPAAADPAGEPHRAVRAGPTETRGPANPAGPADATPPDPRGADPCAGARLLARERCQVAERAKVEAAAAADRLRAARRAYDDAAAKADAAAAKADPRAVRAAKEQAQDAFRVARAAARTRAEAEAAARAWLDEITRLNRAAAAAAREADRHAAVVRELGPQIERLSTEADAARILAESAEAACLAARQALAECEEELAARARAGGPASTREGTATEGTPQPVAPGGSGESAAAPGAAHSPVPGPTEHATAATPPLPSFEDDRAALVAERDREAAIIRLLRGDHRILDRLVAELAGSDPEAQRRWRLLLADLVDAIIGRAIEANALDFPDDDAFWGRFTQAQARDVAAALASLGYRFDGLGGFVDGRVPSQRDLSLAVGYAGLDPMRIRTWPTEAELARLFERVTIAADEFLVREAGGLTLSELVELLGHRADDLTDLWNAWGRLRPLLLELV